MNRVPVSIRGVAELLLARCLFRCCRVRLGKSTVTRSEQNPESLTAMSEQERQVAADTLDRDATVMALTAFWTADRPDRHSAPRSAEATPTRESRNTMMSC